MKRIPNLLSMSRIVLCLPLLLVDAMTVPFWVLYLTAGLTDMLDGFLARRWGVESKFGARLDSLADFVFVLAVGYKLFPLLKLPDALWMMIGLIAMVKTVNAISSYVVIHRIEYMHTKANKLTGFLLFIGVMTIGRSYFIPVAWVIACFALFAAIQEGHLIRSKVKSFSPQPRFKFNTVGLFTTDNKATVDFYTKAFGFTTSWDGIQPNVEMFLGDNRIILFPRDAFEQMVSKKFLYPEGINGTMELSLDVPTFADVDKEYQNALNHGAKSVLPPTTEPWGQRTCYVVDPDGNLIEIGSFVDNYNRKSE